MSRLHVEESLDHEGKSVMYDANEEHPTLLSQESLPFYPSTKTMSRPASVAPNYSFPSLNPMFERLTQVSVCNLTS